MGKRKLSEKENGTVDTSKPSAHYKPQGGRAWTVSIALPGSIVANAQTHELKSALVSQIARTAAIYCVDEIVVFNDGTSQKESGVSEGGVFMARLLQYMDTPPYLRKAIFPMHRDLRFVGLLNPLDTPHHVHMEDDCPFREGVCIQNRKGRSSVEIGLQEPIEVDGNISPGSKVTVRLKEREVVSPRLPREQYGYYWGYQTRMADTLSSVFTESPWDGGYDLTLGTSERGDTVAQTGKDLPHFKHVLLLFGGVAGLEAAIQNDGPLNGIAPSDIFDRWINVCPHQGSRTIRTEEAVLITMSNLKPILETHGLS